MLSLCGGAYHTLRDCYGDSSTRLDTGGVPGNGQHGVEIQPTICGESARVGLV